VQSKNPRETLAVYGTTREEQDFLIERFDGKAWHGQRVELNALTSRQLIEWLEAKFEEHGVEKVIPDGNVLATRWRGQALPIHRDAAFIRFKENDPRQKQVVALYRKVWKLNEAIEAAFSKKYRGPRVPNDLHERIAEYFEERDRTVPWGTALFRIVEEDRKLR
jgi:hypothetical protein